MEAALVFLLLALGAMGLAVLVLPILAMRRSGVATREIAELTRRLRLLEEAVAAGPGLRPAPDVTPEREPAAGAVLTPEAPPPPTPGRPAVDSAGEANVVEPAVEVFPFLPQVPGPVVMPPPSAAAVARPATAETIEAEIGSRWLLYVGVIAIVIGASYFLKYTFDNEWITKTGQVMIGAVIGLAIVWLGTRFSRRGYPLYGQILSGGGIAILYLCVYAAFNFYFLIDRPAAFALMVGVTALGAALADRQQSQGLALMAVGGGFFTPAMIGGEVDAQVALFGYDAVLVAGTMYLATRRDWPALNLVSYFLTIVTVSEWADRFYTPDKYLTTQLFLTLFCAMFVFIARATRRSAPIQSAVTYVLLTSVPLYHLASCLILFPHPVALLVYLIAFSVVMMLAIGRGGSGALRLVLFLAVTLPFFGWLGDHTAAVWRMPAAVTMLAIYAMHLVAQIDILGRDRDRIDHSDVALLHINGAALFFAGYLLLEPWALRMTTTLAAALALWSAGLARFLWTTNRSAALHYVALAAAMATAALAFEFDGAWLTVGVAVEAAGLIWLAVREDRGWMRAGGLLLLTYAAGRVLDLHLQDTPAGHTVLFNARVASSVVVVALIYAAAMARRRVAGTAARREVAALVVTANVLTITLLSSEVWSFWDVRRAFDPSARFGASLSLSVAWAASAVALIVVGIRQRYAPVRYLAIVVFAVTCLKVFLVDLADLDRIYRISSVVGLGVLLLVASYLYQRFGKRIAGQEGPPAE